MSSPNFYVKKFLLVQYNKAIPYRVFPNPFKAEIAPDTSETLQRKVSSPIICSAASTKSRVECVHFMIQLVSLKSLTDKSSNN